MKKMLLAGIAAAAIMVSGCSSVAESVGQAAESVGQAVESAVAQAISGEVTGEVGTTYATQWFEFSVDSIDNVSEYAGYTPEEGYTLFDVVVTEKCTFEEEIPMGTFDFYVDQVDFEEWARPLEALDETMMPEEYYLGTDETVTYHLIFEVPEDVTGMSLYYVEVDESDTEGLTFSVKMN